MIRNRLPKSPVVLDVGGRTAGKQDRSYKSLMPWASEYFVADIEEGRNVSHLMPGFYEIPMASLSVDLVISGQTLEHVMNPFRLVSEMKRVAKVGGFIVLIAPSGGRAHDKVDCWRFMRDAFSAIADECELGVIADWIEAGPSGGSDSEWHDHVAILVKPA
jgi:SAM-dependent methyltransferase